MRHVWSSVVLAFENSKRVLEEVKKPKALGDIRETSDPDEFRLSEELSKNSNILMSQTRHTYTVETSDEDEFLLM